MKEEDFKIFENKYLSLDVGTKKTVVLSNWRIEDKTFNDKNPRKALVFDVLKVDDVEHTISPLEYSTSSRALVAQFKPFILLAEENNKIAFVGVLERVDEKTYTFTVGRAKEPVKPSASDLY